MVNQFEKKVPSRAREQAFRKELESLKRVLKQSKKKYDRLNKKLNLSNKIKKKLRQKNQRLRHELTFCSKIFKDLKKKRREMKKSKDKNFFDQLVVPQVKRVPSKEYIFTSKQKKKRKMKQKQN